MKKGVYKVSRFANAMRNLHALSSAALSQILVEVRTCEIIGRMSLQRLLNPYSTPLPSLPLTLCGLGPCLHLCH